MKTFKELTTGIRSFEDVCEKRGDNARDILPYSNPQTKRQYAANDREKLDYIAEYLQDGYVADWSNRSERKWFPIFEYRGSSGFAFVFSDYVSWNTLTCCGSRLCLPTEELSDFFGKQFSDLHIRLISNNY